MSHRLTGLILLYLVTAASCIAGETTLHKPAEGQKQTDIIVTGSELSGKPISSMLYGHFIESGFGRQVEGMWAEMFFNRSFEEVPPYTQETWNWLGLKPDTDLSKYAWWHSGYEQKPWYLAESNEKASLEFYSHSNFCHGRRGCWIRNNSKDKWASLAQDGIYLTKDRQYEFSGMIRTGPRPYWQIEPYDKVVNAEIRFYPEGDFSKPIMSKPIRIDDFVFKKYTLTFDNTSFEGRGTFSLYIPPESGLNIDDFSLMPADNVYGWHRWALDEAAWKVNPSIIRWPGGCFASFYHWRDGIGKRSDRSPKQSDFWGGLYDNDVGTAEYIRFCRLANAEPFICVNVLTAAPQEAADWVAYCNAPATNPIGALRRRDGFEKPFAVKYWELDNEPFRKYGPMQYARRCVEFCKAMKKVDPTIKIVMPVYGNHYHTNMGKMLEIAGSYIDLVADRAKQESRLRHDLEVISAYNTENQTDIKLCNTEWLAQISDVPFASNALNDEPTPENDTRQNRMIRWRYAMNTARQLLTFQRSGGDLQFCNFNNFANSWGQNVIECAKDQVHLSAAGRVFELLSRSPAAWVLKLGGDAFDPQRDELIAQAAWDIERKSLVLTVLNYRDVQMPVQFDLAALAGTFRRAEKRVLRAPSPASFNTVLDMETIKRDYTIEKLRDVKSYKVMAPAFSIVHTVLR